MIKVSHSFPYKKSTLSKKVQVQEMFDSIAGKYDLGNRVLSLGIDIYWRKKLRSLLLPYHPVHILDIATGTADIAISLAKISPQKIIGVDISEKMLDVGRVKLKQFKLDHIIQLQYGDGEALDFPANRFQAVTIGFGFRNFEDRVKALHEVHRVLTNGGVCMILEFSHPENFIYRLFYGLYLGHVLPFLGGILSGKKTAYRYLDQSIKTFPKNEEVIQQMQQAGFDHVHSNALSGGICRIWVGEKK